MTAPVEPISDAELANLTSDVEELARGYGSDSYYPTSVSTMHRLVVHIAALTAALAAAEARAMPTPRRHETVEEIEALPTGNYIVQFTMFDHLPDVTRVFVKSDGLWWEAASSSEIENEAMVGDLICGPLHLPTLSQAEGR